MTLNEFKAWLDGYLAAGGDDIAEIKKKLDGTREAPSVPADFFRTYTPTFLRNDTDYLPKPPYTVTCATEVN